MFFSWFYYVPLVLHIPQSIHEIPLTKLVLYTRELAYMHKIVSADILCPESQMFLHISSISFSSFLGFLSYSYDFSSIKRKNRKECFKMPIFSKALQQVPTFNDMDGSLEVLWTSVLKYLCHFNLNTE